MPALPPHPGAFEPGLHHRLVRALHPARPHRPPLVAVGRVVHQPGPLLQILAVLLQRLGRCAWSRPGPPRLQDPVWSLVVEPMALLVDPLGGQGLTGLGNEVGNGPQTLCGMRKVPDAQRIRPMQVDASLQPLSASHDGPHRCRLCHAACSGLAFGQVREGRSVGQAREGGPGAGLPLLVGGRGPRLEGAKGARAPFGPFAPNQRDIGAIGTEDQLALGGAWQGGGSSGSRFAWLAVVCTGSKLAPAASVRRRTVAALTCTPTRRLSRSAARAKGIQVARWIRCSWEAGGKLASQERSLRIEGEKPDPTIGAGAVASAQPHVLPAWSLQVAYMLAACEQGRATGGTAGMVALWRLPPIAGRPILRRFLEHLCLQTTDALVKGLFQLLKGGFGMVRSPLVHVCQQLFTQNSPGLIERFVHACPSL
jgi:hypothetical protein